MNAFAVAGIVSRWILASCVTFLPIASPCAFAQAPSASHANPSKAAPQAQSDLGRRLFSDSGLSADGRVSCESCHQAGRAFSDGLPASLGIASQVGNRNAPSLFRVDQQRSFFWDGRRASLEAQAIDPFLNPMEHGLSDGASLLSLLQADAGYVAAFGAAFRGKSAITLDNIARALAAFQRTLDDGPSPFDRYLAGSRGAIPEAARRGWVLFSGSARCTRCHAAEGAAPLFTDHGFHALGVGLKGIERKLPELTRRVDRMQGDTRARDHAISSDADIAALGRFVVTLDPADIGKFKTPSLRNVALTAPYMHDGSVPTLAEAVDLEIYYRSAEDGQPLILTPSEKADLVSFLASLTGAKAASLAGKASLALPSR